MKIKTLHIASVFLAAAIFIVPCTGTHGERHREWREKWKARNNGTGGFVGFVRSFLEGNFALNAGIDGLGLHLNFNGGLQGEKQGHRDSDGGYVAEDGIARDKEGGRDVQEGDKGKGKDTDIVRDEHETGDKIDLRSLPVTE